MTEQDFLGKIALITGSGRGIGKAMAIHFARLGADVAVNYFRNRAPAEETVRQIQALGRRSAAIRANLGSIEDIDFLFHEVERIFGGLDMYISNHASGYNRPIMEQKPKGWDWTMNINARSLLFAAQRATPMMQKRGGGYIVSLSSPGSYRVLPDYAVVGASKAAIEALTRYLAVELAPMNIVVNAISPGVVDTEALQYFAATRKEGVREAIAAHTPAGRLISPEDIAGVTAFLCSPAACMIRGQVILVDGGYSLPAQGEIKT